MLLASSSLSTHYKKNERMCLVLLPKYLEELEKQMDFELKFR